MVRLRSGEKVNWNVRGVLGDLACVGTAREFETVVPSGLFRWLLHRLARAGSFIAVQAGFAFLPEDYLTGLRWPQMLSGRSE